MSVLKEIKDFIGNGGYVPFEHGFKTSLRINARRVYAVDQYYIFYLGGKKKLEELQEKQLEEIYNELNRYLKYCQEEA